MSRAAAALAALLVGCGTSPSPDDGGPPDAGPPTLPGLATCVERFESEGEACEDVDAHCHQFHDHFCSVRALGCVDDVTVVLEHVWVRRFGEPPSCASGERTALAGEGPGGAFVLTGSAASHADGFTSDTQLLFTSGGPVDACDAPRLVVDTFRPPSGEEPSYVAVGEAPIHGRLTVGDTMHELTGTIVFEREDPEDPGRELEGALHLEGEGFTVDGPFHVLACDDLARVNL